MAEEYNIISLILLDILAKVGREDTAASVNISTIAKCLAV